MQTKYKQKKVLAIVQARTDSKRLPGKVLKKINENTLIQLLLGRLKNSKLISEIVLATTASNEDDFLANYINQLGYKVHRGSTTNVLERFFNAAKIFNANTVVRITGDCPLIDSEIVDKVINYYFISDCDYASNTICPTFPDGLDVEVFSFRALKQAFLQAKTDHEKEHVTPYIKNSKKFTLSSYENTEDYSNERWTVDYKIDFELIKSIFLHFYPETNFNMKRIIQYKNSEPHLFEKNKHIKRNEGSFLDNKKKEERFKNF